MAIKFILIHGLGIKSSWKHARQGCIPRTGKNRFSSPFTSRATPPCQFHHFLPPAVGILPSAAEKYPGDASNSCLVSLWGLRGTDYWAWRRSQRMTQFLIQGTLSLPALRRVGATCQVSSPHPAQAIYAWWENKLTIGEGKYREEELLSRQPLPSPGELSKNFHPFSASEALPPLQPKQARWGSSFLES